jgi:electron transport complex protein RnfC
LKQADDEKQQAERAKHRFEARLARLEEEKLARETKAKEAAERRQATMTGTDKNAVAEAMARIAAKKAAALASDETSSVTTTEASTYDSGTPNQVNVKVSDAPVSPTDGISQDAPLSQKDKVAAAIARAKAKKAAQQTDKASLETTDTADSTSEPMAADDKKAKVAAAVARAKAKKAAQQTDKASLETTDTADSTSESMAADDKKAKVAAAVATGSLNSVPTASLSSDELKKARIAATIAKAKAKKASLAQQAKASSDSSISND